jgi:hypothetical protein
MHRCEIIIIFFWPVVAGYINVFSGIHSCMAVVKRAENCF